MIANKECVVRRDRPSEILDGSLIVRRTVTELDQWLFTGERIQHGLGASAFWKRPGSLAPKSSAAAGDQRGKVDAVINAAPLAEIKRRRDMARPFSPK